MNSTNDVFSGSNGNAYSILGLLIKNKIGLKVCHINAQSLTHKIDEFRYVFENSEIDVICVSET